MNRALCILRYGVCEACLGILKLHPDWFLKSGILLPTNNCFSVSILLLCTEWRLKEWSSLNFLIWRVIGVWIGRIIDFDHFCPYIYRNFWSIKTIMLFSMFCSVLYFSLLNDIVFESFIHRMAIVLIRVLFPFWILPKSRGVLCYNPIVP